MLRPWKVTIGGRIDPARASPIYMQIVHAMIHEIERGRLPSGAFLPSSRELAATLGVNRKTVVLAYEDLIAQGWLTSGGTRGTIVSASLPDAKRSIAAPRPQPVTGEVRPDYAYARP